ncbi:alpha-glucosidase [Gammaproteobacteria bacterium]|nr:alpha-glucosidase [Gammaproteobacteria bacterium]
MSKIVLIGAGSLQFGVGMLGDIFQSQPLRGSEVVLHDINPKALETVKAKADAFVAEHQLDFHISSSTDRAACLKGADFVVSSIEVGDRFALWDMDWTIPQQYGIKQVYGENGGPGGLFHALRIIPPILDICADVDRYCPDAWVFNYSNPMSRICTTVHRRFPQMKFVGLCHEIAWMERQLPRILGTSIDEFSFRAAGLNHFSVLLEATYQDGSDAYADVLAKAEAFYQSEPGYSEIYQHYRKTGEVIETETSGQRKRLAVDHVRPWSDRGISKTMIERFGILPITTDSHFGEYLGWAWEASDQQGILDFYAYYRNALGQSDSQITRSLHERAAPIMDGILTDSGYEERAVNVPNRGYIKQLPDWIAVEVPAVIDAQGINGLTMEIPHGPAALLCNQIGIHDLTAEAILRQSRDLVIQALMVDPVVDRVARLPEMVDIFIDRQSPWLDYLK